MQFTHVSLIHLYYLSLFKLFIRIMCVSAAAAHFVGNYIDNI